MKNAFKLTALLAALVCASAYASDDTETKTEMVQITFPEFLYKCHDVKYPCQFYAQDPDGTIFLWVKINPKYPYAILPNNILVFRDKDYVVTDIQEFGQEDFAEVESASACISIMMVPYR